ncbi:MAG: glutamate ligase domain-containing protein [Wenzhouxiangellaceae bacterium]
MIDDSYNANPASLYAALQVLSARPGRRWLVLGDMAELGAGSSKMHREIGRAARDLGIDRLFTLGRRAAAAAAAFGEGGEVFERLDVLVDTLRAGLEPGVTCLVKGSRSAQMDQVVERLREGEVKPC